MSEEFAQVSGSDRVEAERQVIDPAGPAAVAALWLAPFDRPSTRAAYARDLGLPYVIHAYGLADVVAEVLRKANLRTPPPRAYAPGAGAVAPSTTWLPWCLGQGIDPLSRDVCLDVVDGWLSDMAVYASRPRYRGLSRTVRARRFAAVGSFYRWAVPREWACCNPTLLVDRRTAGLRVDVDGLARPCMSLRQLVLLQHAATEYRARRPINRLRAAAVVAVLKATACRVGELVALNLADYTRRTRQLRLHRKGGSVVDMPLAAEAAAPLDAYLDARPDLDAYLDARPDLGGDWYQGRLPLFASTPKADTLAVAEHRMAADEVRDLLRRVCAQSEYPELVEVAEWIGPHGVRAAVLTDLLDAGHPLHQVQELANHRHASTTQLYDRARRRRALPAAECAAARQRAEYELLLAEMGVGDVA